MNDKPSWEDAPEWAQWLAMDDDGEWYWYEEQPDRDSGGWMSLTMRVVSAKGTGWEKTLEQRP